MLGHRSLSSLRGGRPLPRVSHRARETAWREAGAPAFATLTAARPPEVRPAPLPEEELARLVGLEPADLAGPPLPAAAISTGMPFALIPVRDLATLGRARLDPALWQERLAGTWAPHVYVGAPIHSGDADYRVRRFAPAMGISEDPATGAAAAAFAGYLALRPEASDGLSHWLVEQGVEMGRPSLLLLLLITAPGGIPPASGVRISPFSVVQ